MNIELSELLGKNYYYCVEEEAAKFRKTNPKSGYEPESHNDDFIMLPVVDFVFKLLFGDPKRTERIKSLLSSILELPIDDFNELVIINPELPRDFVDDKYGVLDVRAIMKDGKQIDIEIQVLPFPLMPERTLFYWAKMYSQQIKKGDKYSDLKKCITINILDYNFSMAKEVHSVYHISEDEGFDRLTEALEIHFLDLEKLRRGMGVKGLSSSLQKWLRFLAAKRKEEFEMLAKDDKEIKTAYERLQEISADDKQRMVYEAREAWLMDQRTREYCARQEGIEQGIEQGRAEGIIEIKRETALKALNAGLSIDTIAEITGLSEEEIKKLAKA